MSAPYFVTTKRIRDLLSLTASSEVVGFEVEKLQDIKGSLRYRSTGLYPYIVGQFDESFTPDFWGLLYSNAQLGDFGRLRLATSEAALTSGPSVDETKYIWPGSSGFHGAYSFAGTGSVDFGNILDQSTGSFSFQIRMRRTSSGTNEVVLGKKDTTGFNPGYMLFVSNSDAVFQRLSDGVGITSIGYNLGTDFVMVTCIIDRVTDTGYVYEGTTLKSSGDISAVGSLTNSETLQLADNDGEGPSTVDIDEFRFFDNKILVAGDLASGGIADVTSELDVLSLDSTLKLYWRANVDSATATDESGEGNDGTVTNGTYIVPDPASVDLSGYDFVHSKNVISSPAAASWFRFDGDFTNNTDAYIEAGGLSICARFVPGLGPVEGDEQSDGVRGDRLSMYAGGGLEIGGGSSKGNKILSMPGLTTAEYYGGIVPMLNDNQPVAFIEDMSAAYPVEEYRYGYLRNVVAAWRGGSWEVNAELVEP